MKLSFHGPEMGRLMYNAVISSDYNLAISCLMFLAIITLISNLVADFLYVMVDPRIRMGRKELSYVKVFLQEKTG